jgi:hypothetical protein
MQNFRWRFGMSTVESNGPMQCMSATPRISAPFDPADFTCILVCPARKGIAMDDTELKNRFTVMEESVERVYGALRTATEQQAHILNKLNERSESDVSAVHSYMAILGGMHAQEAMLMALIATHPEKAKLHIAFTQFWEQVYRAGIGTEEVGDTVRHAAVQTLARFGTALGKPIL